MKIYKADLLIDTGCDWKNGVCVLYAENETEAKEKTGKYINRNLHGECFADVKNVTENKENDMGIIYQNCFKTND